MPPAITKTQRWLDLISYLVGRRYPVEVGELMERLPAYAALQPESARRTFERDKEELLAADVPLECQRYSVNGEERFGYFLSTHDFFLPYLRIVEGVSAPREHPGYTRPGSVEIAPEHLADAVEALRRVADSAESPFATDARSGFAKLALDLDLSALQETPIYIAEAPGAAESRELLGTLSDALIERRPLRMRYRGAARGETTERVVDPYGLIATGGRWYLIAFDHDRDAIREFRVDRIEVAAADPKAPQFAVPADFSVANYAHRRAWELGGGEAVEARVRFAFPWSLWAEQNGYGELLESEADGASVRSFRVLSPDPFLRWLLSAEGEPELVHPPELVDELNRVAMAVASLYGEGGE